MREDSKSESDIKKELKGETERRLVGRSCKFDVSEAQKMHSAQLGSETASVTEKNTF